MTYSQPMTRAPSIMTDTARFLSSTAPAAPGARGSARGSTAPRPTRPQRRELAGAARDEDSGHKDDDRPPASDVRPHGPSLLFLDRGTSKGDATRQRSRGAATKRRASRGHILRSSSFQPPVESIGAQRI